MLGFCCFKQADRLRCSSMLMLLFPVNACLGTDIPPRRLGGRLWIFLPGDQTWFLNRYQNSNQLNLCWFCSFDNAADQNGSFLRVASGAGYIFAGSLPHTAVRASGYQSGRRWAFSLTTIAEASAFYHSPRLNGNDIILCFRVKAKLPCRIFTCALRCFPRVDGIIIKSF